MVFCVESAEIWFVSQGRPRSYRRQSSPARYTLLTVQKTNMSRSLRNVLDVGMKMHSDGSLESRVNMQALEEKER